MRDAFADELSRLAAVDPRIVLLAGDIGNKMFDCFRDQFPGRFYNCGVAEANMIGVAAGMALSGMRPVVYTIAAFATGRCLEQIRVDLCYHQAAVTIVGVGAGLSYASLGTTHHACEDIAWMRVLPEMVVVCPADPFEVRGALRACLGRDGPNYIRLGKKGEPSIHRSAPTFELGRSNCVRSGDDVALLGVGTSVHIACQVADLLESSGLSCRVESFHTVKPLDESCLAEVFSSYKLVAVIEEHSRLAGAGSAVAEWLAASRQPQPFARLASIALPDKYFHHAGGQESLRCEGGLEPAQIAAALQSMLNESRGLPPPAERSMP